MVGEGLIQGVKDIGREVIPPVHNSLGRYVIWPTVSGAAEVAVGTIGLGVDLARNVLEYCIVRPFVAYPLKLAARGGIELWNQLVRVRIGRHGFGWADRDGRGSIGDGVLFPRIGPIENVWWYGRGANATGNLPGRPGWLANRWSLTLDYGNNRQPWVWRWLYHGDGPGKYIRPSTIPKWYVHDWQHPDAFDRTKISEPRAHSPQWYQDYLNCLTEEAVVMVNDEIRYHLTPRTDGAGGYLNAQGNTVTPPNGMWTGPQINGVNIPGPNDANAKGCYPNPDLWELLTNADPKKQLVGYGYIFRKVKSIIATEHIQLHEQRKWALFEKKLAPKIERARIYAHALENLFKIIHEAPKDLYAFDDLFFKRLLKGVNELLGD